MAAKNRKGKSEKQFFFENRFAMKQDAKNSSFRCLLFLNYFPEFNLLSNRDIFFDCLFSALISLVMLTSFI